MTPLELKIMQVLWRLGPNQVQVVQQELEGGLAYTTVQTMVYRLELKKAVRRVKKIATAFIFEAAVSREGAQGRLVDELLAVILNAVKPRGGNVVDVWHPDAHRLRRRIHGNAVNARVGTPARLRQRQRSLPGTVLR